MLALLTLFACAQTDAPSVGDAPVPLVADVTEQGATRCSPEVTDHRAVIQNWNITLQTSQPSAAMHEVRSRLLAAGASVQNASSNENNSYINARLAPNTDVREIVSGMGLIQNESASHTDYRPQMTQLCERLELLGAADESIRRLLATAKGREFEGLLVHRELSGRERQNVLGQVQNYVQQTTTDQLSVSFQRPPH